jgi:hypothetical protein
MARKEKKFHFIYKTTNILSGRYYIGMHSTDDLEDDYLGSGNRLRLAVRKHGKENFVREILEFLPDRQSLKKRESEIVNLDEVAKEDCMNLTVGGDEWAVKANKIHLEKLKNDEGYKSNFKQNVSDGLKASYQNGRKGKNYHSWKGQTFSDETKRKMSESSKGCGTGKTNSQYGTCWITKEGNNKKIKKEELDTHLTQGWVKGRNMK